MDIDPHKAMLKAQRVALASLFIALVFAVSSMIAAAVFIYKQRLETNQVLSCYVTNQLTRAKSALPTIQYYKDNPGELKIQLADIDRQQQEAAAAWGVCSHPAQLSGGTP